MTASQPMIPTARPVTTPRRFGKYVLIRKLAEGGMAEIYLAKQIGAEGFERDVVIKCMLDHFTQHREFVSMFLDEARLAARLHHPNIVQITDLGVADNRYFICMEYLAGEDLDAVIAAAHYKNQGVPIPIAARIILSVLEGLEFAHGYQEQGQPVELVHRDISPSNIFVTYQGTVKVLDFGIAKASSRMTQTQPGLLKGKWGYMSPEQARGEQQLDARSDLFSLGVTFHELLTARRVFERDTEIGVLLALMDQPIPPPSTHRPEIPPALDRIVMRALERRREDRYASAAEMRADLEEFLRGTASIPGVSQLAQYMQGVFGSVDVERKTKIPSLAELGADALVPPEALSGTEKTLVRPSDPLGTPAVLPQALHTNVSQGLPAGYAPAVVTAPVSPPPARSMGLLVAIGALGAVALLALGGGAVWYFMPRATPPAPVVVTAPAPVPVAVPVPPAPPAPIAEPVAPLPEKQPLAATPDLAPVPVANPEPVPPRAILLTAKEVNATLVKHSSKILDCGAQFLSEVPKDSPVQLQLTIKNSGEVRDAQISNPPSPSQGLGKCLIDRVKRVRFPRNNNSPELSIVIPMRFNQ